MKKNFRTDEICRTCFDIVHQLLQTVQDKDLVINADLNFFGQLLNVSILVIYPVMHKTFVTLQSRKLPAR